MEDFGGVILHDIVHHFPAHRAVFFSAMAAQFVVQVLVDGIVKATTHASCEGLLNFLFSLWRPLPYFTDGSAHASCEGLLNFLFSLWRPFPDFTDGPPLLFDIIRKLYAFFFTLRLRRFFGAASAAGAALPLR